MAVAVMKHSDQKQNKQGEGFNWCLFICLFLNYGLRSVTEVGTETPGRSVQAHLLTLPHVVITSNTGTHGQWGETETLEECCLMTLWQDCCSAQDRFSRKWWYSQLSGSSYINQQSRRFSTDTPMDWSDLGSSSQMTPGCVKLTARANQDKAWFISTHFNISVT